MTNLRSIILFSIALLLLVFTIFGEHGLLHLQEINRELSNLEYKNREIKSEIIALQNRIYAIEHDAEYLETEAREQLGLSKPGEIVYIFPEQRSSHQHEQGENH